jgi:ketosteroid isomerase-like protein
MTAPTSAAATEDLVQLRALEVTIAMAFNNKDADSAMTVYAPGKSLLVFDVVGPPAIYTGWHAYHDALKKFFATFRGPLHFSISELQIQIDVSGKVAYGHSRQHVSGINAKSGKGVDYVVCVTNVYRKRKNGKWLIVQEHVSLPLASWR